MTPPPVEARHSRNAGKRCRVLYKEVYKWKIPNPGLCRVVWWRYLGAFVSEPWPQVWHTGDFARSTLLQCTASTPLAALPDNDAEVVAAIDAENAGSEAGAGGEGGSDVGNAPKGAGVGGPRRDGKQMDLLLEVESLEPKQLMSVRFTSCHHVNCHHVWLRESLVRKGGVHTLQARGACLERFDLVANLGTLQETNDPWLA